ncbi:hypothetical protein Ddye_016181, partial [Dipteronia dyeriana]
MVQLSRAGKIDPQPANPTRTRDRQVANLLSGSPTSSSSSLTCHRPSPIVVVVVVPHLSSSLTCQQRSITRLLSLSNGDRSPTTYRQSPSITLRLSHVIVVVIRSQNCLQNLWIQVQTMTIIPSLGEEDNDTMEPAEANSRSNTPTGSCQDRKRKRTYTVWSSFVICRMTRPLHNLDNSVVCSLFFTDGVSSAVASQSLIGYFRSKPLFPGESVVDQLVENIKLEALIYPFFDELRDPNIHLPNGRLLPPVFNFKHHKLKGLSVDLLVKLIPKHARKQCAWLGLYL